MFASSSHYGPATREQGGENARPKGSSGGGGGGGGGSDVVLDNTSGRVHSLCWDDLLLASISGEQSMQLPEVAPPPTPPLPLFASSVNSNCAIPFRRNTSSNSSNSSSSSSSSRGDRSTLAEYGDDNPGPMPTLAPFGDSRHFRGVATASPPTTNNLKPLPNLNSKFVAESPPSWRFAQPPPVQAPVSSVVGGGSRGAWGVKRNDTTINTSGASFQQREQSFDPEQAVDDLFTLPGRPELKATTTTTADGARTSSSSSSGAIVGDISSRTTAPWLAPRDVQRRVTQGAGGGARQQSTSTSRARTETLQQQQRTRDVAFAVGASQAWKPVAAADAAGSSSSSSSTAATTATTANLTDPSTISAPASSVTTPPATTSPATPVREHTRKPSYDLLAKMIPNLNQLGSKNRIGWHTPSPTATSARRSYGGAAGDGLGTTGSLPEMKSSSQFPQQQSTPSRSTIRGGSSTTTASRNVSTMMDMVVSPAALFSVGGASSGGLELSASRQEKIARYRRKRSARSDVVEADRERGQRRCAEGEQSWMRPRKNGRFCSEGARFVSITTIQPPGDGRRKISCEIAGA